MVLCQQILFEYKKTNFILVLSHRKSIPNITIHINMDNQRIVQVNSCKFRGVYIDNHLTWKEHITKISKQISKSIGIRSRIRYLFPHNVLLDLYYSFVYPYLSCCNLVWASNYPTRIKCLSVLQRRAVRLIAAGGDGKAVGIKTNSCFYNHNILKFSTINKYEICIFIFKNERRLLPSIFKTYFRCYADCHPHFTRAQRNFYTAPARTNIRLFAIKCSGPAIWNTLPLNLRTKTHLSLFKRELRQFFKCSQ